MLTGNEYQDETTRLEFQMRLLDEEK